MPELAAHFRHRDPALGLLQRKHDLRFGELGFFHGNRQAPSCHKLPAFLYFILAGF